jgi:hypothetical protein
MSNTRDTQAPTTNAYVEAIDITPNRVTEFNILFEVATKSKSKEDKAWAKQRLRQMCCEVIQ